MLAGAERGQRHFLKPLRVPAKLSPTWGLGPQPPRRQPAAGHRPVGPPPAPGLLWSRNSEMMMYFWVCTKRDCRVAFSAPGRSGVETLREGSVPTLAPESAPAMRLPVFPPPAPAFPQGPCQQGAGIRGVPRQEVLPACLQLTPVSGPMGMGQRGAQAGAAPSCPPPAAPSPWPWGKPSENSPVQTSGGFPGGPTPPQPRILSDYLLLPPAPPL